MAAEFLPMWAPDARAFKRATFMESTDDVKLLGTVKDGDAEEGEGVQHLATVWFNKGRIFSVHSGLEQVECRM